MANNLKHAKVKHPEFYTKNSYNYKLVYRTVISDGIKRDVIVGRLLPGEKLDVFLSQYFCNLKNLN
jgi:hypothetical protein